MLDIGIRGPVALTPVVLRDVTVTDRFQDRWPPLTDEQWRHVVKVLRRRLLAEDVSMPDLYSDYDTAIAVKSLAVHAPEELAQLLVDRITADPDTRLLWPFEWRGVLAELTPDQRIPLTAAFTRLVDDGRSLDSPAQFEVDIALGCIGAGIDDWQSRLLKKASGTAADRASVVSTIASMWCDPAWAPIVSALVAAGLNSDDSARLIDGIDMHSFGHDDQAHIDARLQALTSLTPYDDPAVTRFAARAQQQIDSSVGRFRDRHW